MSIIYDEIKKDGKLNIERLSKVINHMQEKGCDEIILACTELSLFKNYYEVKEICTDAMNSLVRKSIELSGYVYQKPVYDYSIKSIFKKVLRIAKLKIKKSFR
jgi:aspartate racemase